MWAGGCTWYECTRGPTQHQNNEGTNSQLEGGGEQQNNMGNTDEEGMGDDMNMEDMFENR